MTVRILVNKLDNCFVVHLLEPAIKRCFTGDLCSLGVKCSQNQYIRLVTSHFSIHLDCRLQNKNDVMQKYIGTVAGRTDMQ